MQFSPAGRARLRSQFAEQAAQKQAQREAEAARAACPVCGSPLVCVSLWVGGRGSMPYDLCSQSACSFQRRAW